MKRIGMGVVGAGYMGKAHSVALQAVGAVFGTGLRPVCEMICTRRTPEVHAESLGFSRFTSDWRELVSDEKVEAVMIASPQDTHCDIAVMALEKGKAVFCEKPMGRSVAEALTMCEAAEKSGCCHMVGYNYIKTPASQLAYEMIRGGEIGEITSFRASHLEDFMGDPFTPLSWRTEDVSSGVMGDLSCHIINAVLRLCGPLSHVMGDVHTYYEERFCDETRKEKGRVKNDDHAHILCRTEGGARGSVYVSRIARGEKMGYTYEIYGTKGSIKFSQEDQNALWYYDAEARKGRQGFTKILTESSHPDFAFLCPGDGHGTGYHEQIVIEQRDFLKGIETGSRVWPNFFDGVEVLRVVEAVRNSHAQGLWVKV